MLMLESVINRYLALDPEMLDKLAEFEGKVIKLEINGINRVLYMFPNDSGIQLKSEHEGPVDTVLSGSPVSMLKMGLFSNAADLLLKGDIEITGDTRLGHRFKNVLSQMDIDWAEPLANIVGDSIAYQLQQSARRFGSWGKQTVQSVSTSVSEYLQEESRDVVSQTELEIFYDAVDQLRNDTDRLQARIKSLYR